MAPLPPPPPPPPQRPPPPPPSVAPPSGPQIVTNSYDHAAQRFGILDAFLVIATFFVVGLVLAVTALLVTGDENDLLAGPWLPVLFLGPVLVELGYLWWISRRKGLGFGVDYQLRFQRYDLLAGLLCWVLAWVLAIVVVIATVTLGGSSPTATAADIANDSANEGITIWLVLFAVLGASLVPVVEELVFRGLLWSALEKRGVHNLVALAVTSVLFAAVHLEPGRFFVLLGLGAAIGVGRLATGRIAASIVAHVLLNGLAFTVVLVQAA